MCMCRRRCVNVCRSYVEKKYLVQFLFTPTVECKRKTYRKLCVFFFIIRQENDAFCLFMVSYVWQTYTQFRDEGCVIGRTMRVRRTWTCKIRDFNHLVLSVPLLDIMYMIFGCEHFTQIKRARNVFAEVLNSWMRNSFAKITSPVRG